MIRLKTTVSPMGFQPSEQHEEEVEVEEIQPPSQHESEGEIKQVESEDYN